MNILNSVRPMQSQHQASAIAQIKSAGQVTVSPHTQGVPQVVSNVSATVIQLSVSQATITVAFTQNPNDLYFTSAKIYLRTGNSNPVLVGEGSISPLKIVVTSTTLPATLIVVSAGNWGSTPISSSPSVSVNLSRQSSSPTVNQVIATGSGNFSTTSTTTVSSGIGTAAITPAKLGRLFLTGSVELSINSAGDGAYSRVYRTTGNVPVAGAVVGGSDSQIVFAGATDLGVASGFFSCGIGRFDLGLSTTTAYKYYFTLEAVTGGTATLNFGNPQNSQLQVTEI